MAGAKDKFGNSATTGKNLGTFGYDIIINGKVSGGQLMDLYLEDGRWTGTNKQGNKYYWNNTRWIYIGKGTITANLVQDAAPVVPSVLNVLGLDVAKKVVQKSAFTQGEAPDPTAQQAGIFDEFGGTIQFGKTPDLLRYAGWVLLAVVGIFYFMRPPRKRRR